MNRLQKVLDFIEAKTDIDGKQCVTATDVALALNIYRSNASADLNKLFLEGKISKKGTRPTFYYRLNKLRDIEYINNMQQEKAFAKIIGSSGSIRSQIELAKAAIAYPPKGLHTLIHGESGVGKNLLAESMWQYAKEYWGKDIPFITFCCADYADNAQLLLSQLFGYVKGAFTGAVDNHEGVVERANGGILFLDEIHRLPPTGQELLFMLVDKGIYRKLGETKEEHKIDLMIIGATSEDINSSLLTTFRRRIPVQIFLPKITERPIGERINLICYFIKQEALRLKHSIYITGEALKTFAYYNSPANIGELRNDILLCCAKGYLSCLAGKKNNINIDVNHIPQRIFSMVKKQTILDEKIINLFKKGILIEANGIIDEEILRTQYDLHVDFYEYVEEKIRAYKSKLMTDKEIEVYLSNELDRYFDIQAQQFLRNDVNKMFTAIIEESIYQVAKDLLEKIILKLGYKYDKSTMVALAWHLQQFKERILSGKTIYNSNLAKIKEEYKEIFTVIEEYKSILSAKLNIPISIDELGFIVMFLVHRKTNNYIKKHIGIVIVAHGRYTASSIAEVANNLLGIEKIYSIDIPLSKNNNETVNELQALIKSADEGLGVILLVDMGFLVTMEDTLSRQTGTKVKILPNVTTALVLETGKKVFSDIDNIDEAVKTIYESYNEYVSTFKNRNFELIQDDTNKKRKIIVLCCSSGKGVAKKLEEILCENIENINMLQIITMGIGEDLNRLVEQYKDRILFILGSIDPKFVNIPFIDIKNIFSNEGLDYIRKIVDNNIVCTFDFEKNEVKDVYNLLGSQLSKFVKNIQIILIKEVCEHIVDKLVPYFFGNNPRKDEYIRAYLHVACMYDRIASNEALIEPSWGETLKRERKADFNFLVELFEEVNEFISIKVPKGELYYFLNSLPDRK